MKPLISFSILVILASCAGTKKASNKSVSDITNSDFKPVKSVRYKKSDDSFKQVKSKYSEELNKESLERVFLYDGDFDEKGTLNQISKLCHEKDFEDAYEIVRENSKKFIKNPIFWNHVGACFILEKDYRKALLFLNRALSLKGNYAPALNNLGIMYLRKGDFSRALVALKRAKKSSRFSKTPLFNLAALYLKFAQYDLAITTLKPMAKGNTNDVDVLSMLGTAYLMKNNFKSADFWFSRISSDFLEYPNVGINYALNSFKLGKSEEAKKILNDVSIKENKNWKPYLDEVKAIVGK